MPPKCKAAAAGARKRSAPAAAVDGSSARRGQKAARVPAACGTCNGEAWLQARCAGGVCEECDNGNKLLAAGPMPLGVVARDLSARWAAAGGGAPDDATSASDSNETAGVVAEQTDSARPTTAPLIKVESASAESAEASAAVKGASVVPLSPAAAKPSAAATAGADQPRASKRR